MTTTRDTFTISCREVLSLRAEIVEAEEQIQALRRKVQDLREQIGVIQDTCLHPVEKQKKCAGGWMNQRWIGCSICGAITRTTDKSKPYPSGLAFQGEPDIQFPYAYS